MGETKTNWVAHIHRTSGSTSTNDHEIHEHLGATVDDQHQATPSQFSELMLRAVGPTRSSAFDDAADAIRDGFKQMSAESKDGLFELCKRLRIRATGGTP